LKAGLLRQRRNLIIANLVILLLCLADVKIDKFSLLGVVFSFSENYKLAYQFIWLIWLYFLYRYFVYFLEEAPAELKKYWTREFEIAVNPAIKSIVYGAHEKLNDDCLFSYASLRNRDWVYFGQKYISKLDSSKDQSEETIENIEMPINRWTILPYEIYAFIRFAFLTPAVTDYIFAFIFSAVVIGITLITSWPGNPNGILT